MPSRKADETAPTWTFLSNHAHVLLLIAQDPDVTLREVADRVGITERAVQRLVADLEEARYLERQRAGRRNRYKVHPELPLRHPVEAHREVGALIALVMPSHGGGRADPPLRSGGPGGGDPARPPSRARAGKPADPAGPKAGARPTSRACAAPQSLRATSPASVVGGRARPATAGGVSPR
ncbi:winged helix-turn-helix domain-containing protein [Paludisphaera sp. Pla2]|uniref:Winged helix-turn-helix domain-containing protein n=1 Tax=Paludisphaera mucosa TaxID=3030827 RepID=A0ABT6F9Q1_9BACT|nr:winged helix-turn-helix domain-containing protein [Paludisphaera mucosa]MDG3004320.1 winged helix-turn-helix domain-containing protein [Paludisphaera mucosa]